MVVVVLVVVQTVQFGWSGHGASHDHREKCEYLKVEEEEEVLVVN